MQMVKNSDLDVVPIFLSKNLTHLFLIETLQSYFSVAKQRYVSLSWFFKTQSILERHLKIGESLTAEQLVEQTTANGQVSMLRGSPGFKFVNVEDNGDSYIALQWENLEARVIRPNLECTNGYIHVIDKVIMKKRDISISKSAINLASSMTVISATILYWLLH